MMNTFAVVNHFTAVTFRLQPPWVSLGLRPSGDLPPCAPSAAVRPSWNYAFSHLLPPLCLRLPPLLLFTPASPLSQAELVPFRVSRGGNSVSRVSHVLETPIPRRRW